MIDFFKKQRASSILGLTLDGNRLEAVVLRRTNGSIQVRQTVVAALALSPLTADPELVGREIRNHLEQAGIRERRCVVCLPLGMVLTLQTKLPDLPEADIESFLQIEAERGFHSGLRKSVHRHLAITRGKRGAICRFDGHSAHPIDDFGKGVESRATQAGRLLPGRGRTGEPAKDSADGCPCPGHREITR